MSDKREIVIKDACILIDLVDLGLLADFFKLELSAFTTEQVIGEISNETHKEEVSKFIKAGMLQIDNEGSFEVIAELFDEHSGLSVPDCSVLEFALRRNAIIYSSDGSLRKISNRQHLIVRGILWIIEELCEKKILSTSQAIEKLNLYESVNQRSPINEIKKLINKYQIIQ